MKTENIASQKNRLLGEIKEKTRLVRVLFVDNGGVTRARSVSSQFVEELLEEGTRFIRAIQDFAPFESYFTSGSFDAASDEVYLKPDPSTFSLVPYLPRTCRFFGNFYEPSGERWGFDPRLCFERMLAKAGARGLGFLASPELEFYLFQSGPGQAVSGMPFHNYLRSPANVGPSFSNSAYDQVASFSLELIDNLGIMNQEVVRFVKEGGTGKYEINSLPTEGMRFADGIITTKEAVKYIARKHGYTATFLPQPSPLVPGAGMHTHMSLFDLRTGKNIFQDETDEYGLSEVAYHFIGGLMAHTRALCLVVASSVNSYKRLVPRTWAADAVAYGPGNRSAAIRIPSYHANSRTDTARIEYRIPDATCNPYLGFACILAAGLEGIEKERDPGDPVLKDIGRISTKEKRDLGLEPLPSTLYEAIVDAEKDELIRNTLGTAFFGEFIALKKFEWNTYAGQLTEWETSNLFETY